jgi:hypothetical protein
MRHHILAAAAAIAVSTPAWATDLMCNKDQSNCVVESRDLTIGDEVGIFTRNNELVAVGVVKSMRGQRRSVEITESTGTIRKGHRLALLERDAPTSQRAEMRVWRDQAPWTVGGSVGWTSVGIGDGSPATELSAFGAKRHWENLELIGRASMLVMEGELSRTADRVGGLETQPISLRGIGVLGGVGHTWFHNRPVSARGELGAGFMHVGATIGGDAGAVEGSGYDSLVSNGFGKYIRGSVAAQYNFNPWKIELGLAQTMFHDAFGTTIGLGILKDLR